MIRRCKVNEIITVTVEVWLNNYVVTIDTFWSADSNGELTCTSAPSITQETTLESGQDAVFNARSMDAHLAGVRCTHHSKSERASVDRFAYMIQSTG